MVKVKVIFDYDAAQEDELTIKKDDIISDVKKQPGGWWEGILNGRRGVFPDNFVEDYTPPPSSEPMKGPKPGAGSNVSDLRNRIGGNIRAGPPPPTKTGGGSLGGGKSKQMAAVLFEYKPEQPDELELNEGDEVEIVRMAEEGWWEGVLRGKTGMFPSNFVKLIETAHVAAPSPASAGYAPGAPKHNDNNMVAKGNTGGRPPAAEVHKKAMPPPPVEPASPPLLPERNRGVKAKVLYSYAACNNDELDLVEGQVILVTDMKLDDAGWWKGELGNKVGVFPDNFVQLIDDKPSQPSLGPPAPSQEAPPMVSRARAPKAPPQPPPEVEPPVKLPPKPHAHRPDMTATDSGRGPTPPMTKTEPMRPVVNGGVDGMALAALREEMEKLRSSMVSRESYELVQRELKATKEALDTYKRDNNKKLLDLMKEIDDERKQSVQINVELTRIRKLAEDHWASK